IEDPNPDPASRGACPGRAAGCRGQSPDAPEQSLQVRFLSLLSWSAKEVTMLTDTLAKEFRRFRWSLLIRGALALGIGILILVRPLDSIAALALVIAIWALFAGITEIVQSFEIRPYFKSWWMLLVSGLISAAFGVAALYYYPGLSLAFAVTWVS